MKEDYKMSLVAELWLMPWKITFNMMETMGQAYMPRYHALH